MKSRRMRWAGNVARMGEKRNVYKILVGKPEGKRIHDFLFTISSIWCNIRKKQVQSQISQQMAPHVAKYELML
jgi:hypothetical protein